MSFDMNFETFVFEADKVDTEIGSIIDNRAKKLKNEVQKDAPTRTGEFKAGWIVKDSTVKNGDGFTHEAIVKNKDKYQLTHLLANDHKNKWGGTTKAVSNFNAIARRNITEFNKEIESFDVQKYIEAQKQ